jgi:prepilin-type N-terminal cleavage/methylation domain-containing protein
MIRKFPLFPVRSGAQNARPHGFRLIRSSEGIEGPRRPNGFTLMELLIVMAIIAILMLIAIPTIGCAVGARGAAGGDAVRLDLPG